MWTNGSSSAFEPPANARTTGNPSPSWPRGPVVTERTGRSVSVGPAAVTLGKVNVSAVIAGISGLLFSDTRYNRTAVRLFRDALPGALRGVLLGGRALVVQTAAGVLQMCPHEPLELLQLGGVGDQD